MNGCKIGIFHDFGQKLEIFKLLLLGQRRSTMCSVMFYIENKHFNTIQI